MGHRDFTAPRAQSAAISAANETRSAKGAHGGGRLSPGQEANIRALAEVLGSEQGWWLWGPAGEGRSKGKQPCSIDADGAVSTYWRERPGLCLDDALAQVGETPRGNGQPVGGVGFSIKRATNARAVVLDFDHVIHDGVPGAVAREVLKRFAGTYVETSPSGNGLRVVCLAGVQGHGWPHKTAKKPLQGGSVEVYAPDNSKNKFFRLSGNRRDGHPQKVTEQAEALAWLVALEAQRHSGNPASKTRTRSATQGATGGAVGVVKAGNSKDAQWGVVVRWGKEVPPNWGEAAKPAKDIIRSFKTSAGMRPDSAIARVMRGDLGDDPSAIDTFVVCEAIRRGARSFDDVREVWESTPAWRDEKPGERPGYVESTIKDGLVRVTAEREQWLEEAAGGPEVFGRLAALKEAAQAKGVRLTTTAKGTRLTATLGNAKAILELDPDYAGCFRFNEFTGDIERTCSLSAFDAGACDKPGALTDDDVSRVRLGLEAHYRVAVDRDTANEAISAVAKAKGVAWNPLRDRLLELEAAWIADGGQPRLDTWLTRHTRARTDWRGAPLEDYLGQVSRLQLVAAVARVFRPGCKVDAQTALVGAGGVGKSTVWRALADGLLPGLFTDTVPNLDSDPAKLYEATRGKLIAEMAEGAAIRRSELNSTKAGLTSGGARFRKPYARHSEEVLRQFVLVSTANDMEFLPNGDAALRRRFWPVVVQGDERNPLDVGALRREAGMLWGEAMARYRAMCEAQGLQLSGAGVEADLPLYISERGNPQAYAGWQALLCELSDEGGPFADVLQQINSRWWHGAEGDGIVVAGVLGRMPTEGCTTREIGEALGYERGREPAGARQVAEWCRANELVGRKAKDGMRWWKSEAAPER